MPVVLENPYTTVAEVGAECANSAAAEADIYATAINLASRTIDQLTKRDFLYHDYSAADLTVEEVWCAGDCIFFPWPIVSLTQVKQVDTVLLAANYAISYAPGAQVERLPYLTGYLAEFGQPHAPVSNESLNSVYRFEDYARRRQLTVRGTFGYLPAGGLGAPDYTAPPQGLPSAVRRAATLIAARWSGRYRKEAVGLDGAAVSILETDIPKQALELLKLNKREVI